MLNSKPNDAKSSTTAKSLIWLAKNTFQEKRSSLFSARRDDEEEKALMRLPPVAFGSEWIWKEKKMASVPKFVINLPFSPSLIWR